MKILILLLLTSLYSVGYGQELLNDTEIENKTDAGEGDLYKSSNSGFYYIGNTSGTLTRISPQDLSFDSETESLTISGGNSIDISSNAYISICEFIRGEAVLEQTGRILFSVHEDLNGYKTSALTASILELSPSTSSSNIIIKAEILRNGSVIPINEVVSFNAGTTYSGTSNGLSDVQVLTGDVIRIVIDQTPSNLSDAPKGLTATLKLKKA